MFHFDTFHSLYCAFYAVIGRLLVLILSTVHCTPFTFAVSYFTVLHLFASVSPHPLLTTFSFITFIQAVEALLATTHVATSVENLGTRLKTADPCSGQEVTSFPTTILTLDSPTTSQPEAIHLNTNQSSEENLAQVEEIVQKYELESGQSLTVKGNLKKNLGFWRSIGAPNFILTII